MLGVFAVACLSILRCAAIGNIGYRPHADPTGAVETDDVKPIAGSHAGPMNAGLSDSKPPAASSTEKLSRKSPIEVGIFSSDNHGIFASDKAKAGENHYSHWSFMKDIPAGVKGPFANPVGQVSTAVSSSVEVKADASKASTTESSTAVSSSAEVNVDSSKASPSVAVNAKSSVEVVANPVANSASFQHDIEVEAAPTSKSYMKFDHNQLDHPEEDPKIVDRISRARTEKATNNGGSTVQFIFLACAVCAMIAWLYLFECKNRSWSYLSFGKQSQMGQYDKDWQTQFEKKFNKAKPHGRMHTALEPMVQDATKAIGFVAGAKSPYHDEGEL